MMRVEARNAMLTWLVGSVVVRGSVGVAQGVPLQREAGIAPFAEPPHARPLARSCGDGLTACDATCVDIRTGCEMNAATGRGCCRAADGHVATGSDDRVCK